MRGWVGAVAALALADVICDRRGWPTLSSTTRHLLHTQTPAGRAAFIAGWAALTVWFVPHIVNAVGGCGDPSCADCATEWGRAMGTLVGTTMGTAPLI
jgi:hypothetical protein